ncbi:phage major capsid protein [candidate division WOR-3 bacterium]|nr:phage major capsid protein [candidate division WOR-3 bacterium]
MAALTELETATQMYFMPVVQNQIWTVSPILHRIFKMAKEGQWGLASPSYDGREIVEPLDYQTVVSAGAQHGAYNTGTTWQWGEQASLGGAHYSWKMYFVGIAIHNLNVAYQQGKSKLFDLAAQRLKSAAHVLRDDLATDFYANNDGTGDNMMGMASLTSNTATIGGIAQGATGWWQVYKDAPGARDLSWNILNVGWYATKKYGAQDPPTLLVTTEGAMQVYEENLTKVTTTGGGALASLPLVALMAGTKGPRVIDGGFEAFYFKRIPMVSDPYCTAGKLYIINERYLHWRVLKNFESTGWIQQRVNGLDKATCTIFGYGAMTSSANRKHGILADLNES